MDGDGGEVEWEAREVLADPVVEVQLALLDQLGDGYAGEHLAERPDVEPGLDVVRPVRLAVGQAVRLLYEWLAILGDEHRSREGPVGSQVPHEVFERLPLLRRRVGRRARLAWSIAWVRTVRGRTRGSERSDEQHRGGSGDPVHRAVGGAIGAGRISRGGC